MSYTMFSTGPGFLILLEEVGSIITCLSMVWMVLGMGRGEGCVGKRKDFSQSIHVFEFAFLNKYKAQYTHSLIVDLSLPRSKWQFC